MCVFRNVTFILFTLANLNYLPKSAKYQYVFVGLFQQKTTFRKRTDDGKIMTKYH